MPSLFPGMDPYLENPGYWSDFHNTFINYWREAVADALPVQYEASINECVYLVQRDLDAADRRDADVAVTREKNVQTDSGSLSSITANGTVATLEPVTVRLDVLDGPRETYVEIRHQPDRSLVSVLELLSPANKQALLNQNVHLIALDLLRGGQHGYCAILGNLVEMANAFCAAC